jgi:hypothetical protein
MGKFHSAQTLRPHLDLQVVGRIRSSKARGADLRKAGPPLVRMEERGPWVAP